MVFLEHEDTIPNGTAPDESARIRQKLSKKMTTKTILYMDNKLQMDMKSFRRT